MANEPDELIDDEISSIANKPTRHPMITNAGTLGRLPVVDMSTWRQPMDNVNRIKFDDIQKQIYLDHLAANGLKGRAAKAAGVLGSTVIYHAKKDPEFAEAMAIAGEYYRDSFVDHAMTLAYEGIEVRKYNRNGELVEKRRDYPIKLIEMELKRVEPEYRDKQELKVSGQMGVLVAPAQVSPTAWAEQAALAADVAIEAERVENENNAEG